MKAILLVGVLVVSIGSTLFAASSKICFGAIKNEETKGSILSLEISDAAISVRNIKGDYDYDGVYPAYNSSVNGRDGRVYYEFKGRNTDYQDVVMIDEALFNDGTTGLFQIRARGEGFFNAVFQCRDA